MSDRGRFWIVALGYAVFCGICARAVEAWPANHPSDSHSPRGYFDALDIDEEHIKRVVWHMKDGRAFEIRPRPKHTLLVKEERTGR